MSRNHHKRTSFVNPKWMKQSASYKLSDAASITVAVSIRGTKDLVGKENASIDKIKAVGSGDATGGKLAIAQVRISDIKRPFILTGKNIETGANVSYKYILEGFTPKQI